MSVEVHIEWEGKTHFIGRLHTAERSPSVSFEYAPEWLGRFREGGRFARTPAPRPTSSHPAT